MSKVAKIRLYWKRSVTSGPLTRKLTISNNGETIVIDLPIELEEYVIEVKAFGVVVFSTEIKDDEGFVVQSITFSFTLGDLTAPQPDTDLGFEILAITEVPDPVPV